MLIADFLKIPRVSVDVINFSAHHVSTGQVGAYIKKLYEEEHFSHIGYRTENRKGFIRYVIYTIPTSIAVIQYFKDRCPAMVENECKALEGVAHKWNVWDNGFEEVTFTN